MLLPTFIITFNSDTHISHVCVSFYMVYLSHSIDMHKNKKKQTAVFEIKRAWEGPWPAQVFEFPYNFSSNLAGVFFSQDGRGRRWQQPAGIFYLEWVGSSQPCQGSAALLWVFKPLIFFLKLVAPIIMGVLEMAGSAWVRLVYISSYSVFTSSARFELRIYEFGLWCSKINK